MSLSSSDNMSLTNSPIELAIFDFDGTLVDTAPDLVRTTNLFLQRHGRQPLPTQTIVDHIGMGLRRLVLDFFPELGEDQKKQDALEQEFLSLYDQEFTCSPQLFSGAAEFLKAWPGHLAILSNKRERYLEPILAELELLHLPWCAIIGGDTFAHMKPHPLPFLQVCAAANVSVDAAVMIGDGLPDIKGAKQAQMRSIVAGWGYGNVTELESYGAWKTAANFFELGQLLLP